MLSAKQKIIKEYLIKHKVINLEKATLLIGANVYSNQTKYVGKVMSRMVKNGTIERIKPGLFKMAVQPSIPLFEGVDKRVGDGFQKIGGK